MAVSPVYTTREKLEKRMSAVGVDDRIDDDLTSLTEVIADATVEVNGYCLTQYSATQLAASDWIQKKTLDVACFFLCLRRNNPPPQSVQFMYEKAIADLELVRAGSIRIPDAATRKAAAPTLSNQRVNLWPHPHVVTIPHSSTGNPEGYDQSTDPHDFEPNPHG